MSSLPGVAPGMALAAVATTGYSGFLAGPPLIRLATERVGLPAALGIVSVMCALTAVHVASIVPGLPGPSRTLRDPMDILMPLEERRLP